MVFVTGGRFKGRGLPGEGEDEEAAMRKGGGSLLEEGTPCDGVPQVGRLSLGGLDQ